MTGVGHCPFGHPVLPPPKIPEATVNADKITIDCINSPVNRVAAIPPFHRSSRDSLAERTGVKHYDRADCRDWSSDLTTPGPGPEAPSVLGARAGGGFLPRVK